MFLSIEYPLVEIITILTEKASFSLRRLLNAMDVLKTFQRQLNISLLDTEINYNNKKVDIIVVNYVSNVQLYKQMHNTDINKKV